MDGHAIDETSAVGGDPNLLEPRLHHNKCTMKAEGTIVTDSKPKQEPRPDPQPDSKRATRNGGYTIPAQMF